MTDISQFSVGHKQEKILPDAKSDLFLVMLVLNLQDISVRKSEKIHGKLGYNHF